MTPHSIYLILILFLVTMGGAGAFLFFGLVYLIHVFYA